MKCIAYLINIIALLGAVNWLLIGLARIDIISFLFGQMNMASRVAYIVLGAGHTYPTLYILL